MKPICKMTTNLSETTRSLVLASTLFILISSAAWGGKPDTSIPTKPEQDDQGHPTDYKNPIKDGVTPGGIPHYHVTVCEGFTLGPWYPWGNGHRDAEPMQKSNRDLTPASKGGRSHGDAGTAGGSDGGVSITSRTVGTSEATITLKENDGTVKQIVLLIRVIDCAHRAGTKGIATGLPSGNPLETLVRDGQLKIDTVGTGETIGHIADLQIQNLTDQLVSFMVPPMILESGSGKNQHYACPRAQSVALGPHQKKTVPMNGVCLVRNKPPVGKGVTGDLLINEGTPDEPQNPDSHLSKKNVRTLLRLATSKYEAAEQLQKDGSLKDIPYKDEQKQKNIVVEWSTWSDPRISELTGAPPATKEDLKKVVYKQIEEHGPVTPEKKKKIDEGIDTIFEKIELTTEKAKSLEKPDPFASVESTGEEEKGENNPAPINIADNTPTPPSPVPPTTDAKPSTSGEKEQPPVVDDKARQAWEKEAPLIDQTPDDSKTTTEPLPHGGERKIYRNHAGQRISEQDSDGFSAAPTREKKILRYHANGKEAEVTEEAGDKVTSTETSPNGLPIRIEVEDRKKRRKTIQTWPPGSGKEGVTNVFRRKDQPVSMGPGKWEEVDAKGSKPGSKTKP